MTPEALYLHGFNLLPQFGPARLLKLIRHFPDLRQAFEASEQKLLESGLEAEIARIFLAHRRTLDLGREEDRLRGEGVGILTVKDGNYPKLLKEIPKYPPILYCRGIMDEPDELCVSVVGTRMVTNYGRAVMPALIGPLAEAGITLVSGMAYGVDSIVHDLAIKKSRRTIAVLGGGLDDRSLYPKHHQMLAQRILDGGGALLSEYPLGVPSLKHHFISRNRIISGLSLATAIIECDLKSGSLITAKHALDQNRSVFAVPGPIYAPASQGPNNLIKMGAKPFTKAEDLLEDLNLQNLPQTREAQKAFGDTPAETSLLGLLGREPVHINELIKHSGLEAGEATSTLTFLEIKGKIRNLGGQQYILSR